MIVALFFPLDGEKRDRVLFDVASNEAVIIHFDFGRYFVERCAVCRDVNFTSNCCVPC